MNVRVIKKAFGLFLVDIVLIIGIIILQFRTDSNILEKLGNLQITLAQNEEAAEGELSLRNKLLANYNGISIHSDEQNCAKALFKNDEAPVDVQLLSYEKNEEKNQFVFEFTEGIKLYLSLASDEENSALSINANLPSKVTDFYLPYNFAYNMKIQKDEGNKVILNNKETAWSFTTENIQDGFIHFNKTNAAAHYAIYDDTTKKFTFDSITELALADETAFKTTVTGFKDNLIAAFKASLSDNSYTEAGAVAYVAAMAENGKYQLAVDEIPSSYKKSEGRTYLSAPFFNSLSKMDATLDAAITESNTQITKAAANGSLDIFTTRNLGSHLYVHPDSSAVIKILNNAANANIEAVGIAQVTGIVRTYIELTEIYPDYAKILEPVMTACMDRIAAGCSFTNNVLTISENDTFLSVVQAIEAGMAVMRYGQLCGNQTYVKAGRVLVNSYMAESSSFDLRTLSNLYPIIAYDNWYYPHFKKIRTNGNNKMWAWTSAKDIKFNKNTDTEYSLSIDFPESYIHYVIFKGIPQFETIYIYNMAFRTDPRFETYNSSGYVYKGPTYTLLLKSRHKSKLEEVRMELGYLVDADIPKYVEPEKKPPKTETSSEADKKEDTSAESTTASSEASTKPETPAAASPDSSAPATANSTPAASTEATAEQPQEAAAPAPAEEAPKPAPAAPKKFTVRITAGKASNADLYHYISDYLGISTTAARTHLRNLPSDLKTGCSESEADYFISELERLGATAEKIEE